MKAIFIRNTRAVKYAHAIVQKYKLCESRNRDMLRDCIGERVAIVLTGGKDGPMVIGYADMTHSVWVGYEGFRNLYLDHCVPPGSKYDCKPGSHKYLYYFRNAEQCEPYPLPKNAVRHGRSWCEWDA